MRLRLLLASTAAVALLASGCSSDSGSSASGSSEGGSAASAPSASTAASSAAASAVASSAPASSAAGGAWATGQDVLDALAAAGIPCTWSGDGEQVMDFDFLTGQASTLPAVRCDGYGVQLTESRDAFVASIKTVSECVPPSAEDMASDVVQTEFVVGDNWVIFPDGNYPENAQPADFVDAFGGEAMTIIDVFLEACPDAVIPEPAASPAPSAQ